jgi:aspartyl protease family protein
MSGYQDDSTAGSGLLGHSLKLVLSVLVAGVAVVLLADRGDEGASAPGRDPAVASAAASAQKAAPFSELVLRAGAHGHFTVDASVNGQTLTFLVDTGASSIYLTPQDAAALGWTPPRLTYSERYHTAAGEVRAAPVTLRSLRIGELEPYDLPASIGEAPSSMSLLGMTFLKRFDSYQVRGDRLILTW